MDCGADILKLAELLKTNNDSDSEDDCPKNTLSSVGPGHVGPKTGAKSSAKPHLTTIKKQTKDIWDEEELAQGTEFNDEDDPRPEPKYEMIYKQAITTEVMFLQLGNKTNASASCENLVVHIFLPGCQCSEITLDVKENYLDCRSPKYKLGLYLPHQNDPNLAKAVWNPKDESLSVTLFLKRDFDDFNF